MQVVEQNRIIFRSIAKADYEQATDLFINGYLKSAPLSSSMAKTDDPETSYPRVHAHVQRLLVQDISFAAFDKMSGKMVGIMVNYMVKSKQEVATLDEWLEKLPNSKARVMFFCEKVIGIRSLFDNKSDGKEILVFDFHSMYVKPEFRGKKIGSILLDLSLEKAKSVGATQGTAMCSSDFSRRIFESKGFKVTKNEKYKDSKDDEGKVLFPMLPEGNENIGTGYCRDIY